ncbi:hypothetical protein R9X50_00259800 [Acrodontium crateriforme]|uniref:Zn(2)-C6 fungal-type domain-containing protein n=1 Tax=Acrodontium crateriforme TaxID=150365 RepID=A0AAQ3M2R8_9PEZI|nr:hypothetical protein R9X50_00259800 [Acrodontium crateriforme]
MAASAFDMPAAAAHVQPKASSQQPEQAAHQRTYQACIPCRRRKVRCDLGSVDNPHDPPCKRCSRESKECFFSATRRKKKNSSGDADSDAGGDAVYEIKSGRKRLRAASPSVERDTYEEEAEYDEPRTPGGSIGRPIPLRRPTMSNPVQYGEEDERASEQTAALLQTAELHGGHDALKLLYSAAVHGRAGSSASQGRPGFPGMSPHSLPPATSPIMEKGVANRTNSYTSGPMAMYQNDPLWKTKVDPQLHRGSTSAPSPQDSAAYVSALKAWSRFRFVRAGWFTAKEGVDYVRYFYKYMAPLTPVALPDFRAYENHEKLLTQEPMLTITILLVASRYMTLEGAGATSRPYSIHQKLWSYLSGMINRVVWGQEQFGGGFCGAGAEPGSDVHPLSRKGLRTLGTVESLVVLTEWHPRAMHFPPDEADDELMVPDEPVSTPGLEVPDGAKGIGGQRMDAWLEPCWRSDRMCWMLLGISMSLAFEIGVFDSSDWQRHAKGTNGAPLSAVELQAYDKRRGNVRDLLLIYVTQTSGRLGLTTMLPSNYTKPEDSDLWKRTLGQHGSIQETVLHFWLRIAAVMRDGNTRIFANKDFTRDLIKNGNYKAELDKIQGPMDNWRRDFDAAASIPKLMRHILDIEYEYCRVYLNSLALQAVAERCANENPLSMVEHPPHELARSVTTNGIRSDVAIDPSTLSKWLGGDRKYMVAVGDSARNLLKIVVDGLYPNQMLKHAPVRTYFRIISVAIMLLKSFSLGASESDVSESLMLMDRTVEALRTCIVDDVHVASRFADLLYTLTQNLKPRLVRIAADGRTGRSRRMSQAGTPAAAGQIQRNGTQGKLSHNGLQQWQFGGQNVSNAMASNSVHGVQDPLLGISTDAYDLMGGDNTYSVMPPPSFGFASPGTRTANGVTPTNGFDPYANGNFGDGDQDWLALPLDPLLNLSNADVEGSMYGPQLGGHDMLELLLSTNNVNGFSA